MTPRWVVYDEPAGGGGGGPWDPSQLTTLEAWYDADAITGLNNNDPVSTWADSSSSGYDLTQTSTARPLYKTNTLNGLPVVEFDGNDDLLQRGTSALGQAVGGLTLYSVIRYNQSQSIRYPVFVSTGSGVTRAALITNSGGTPQAGGRRLDNDSFQSVQSNTVVGLGNFAIHGAVFAYSAATLSQYVNGTITQSAFQTQGSTSNTASTLFSIGSAASSPSNFASASTIGEVLIVHDALSTSDREKLEGYLAHKWGLTGNLPASHPYKNAAP